MDEYITMSEALTITLISMVSVFVILILISFLISSLKTIKPKSTIIDSQKSSGKKKTKEKIGEEEVVAIAAAIAMLMDGKDYNIKAVNKIE